MSDAIRLKRLSENIKKNGFDYRLIQRNENRAMYGQHNRLGRLIAYEVFIVQQRKPNFRSAEDMTNYDLVEHFPSNEDFGKIAWTFPKLELAEKAFESK